MSPAIAPPTAGGGHDPPTQQPEEEIAVRVIPASEDVEEPAADTTSFLCPLVPLPTATLANGMHVLLVQSTSTDLSPAGLQALLVPASCWEDGPRDHQARRNNDSRKAARELRGWLMVLATLIASITYASGLSPPGGFQSGDSDDDRFNPATPVLRYRSPWRYKTFYYCNTVAFALSLSTMLLVASQDLRRLAKIKVLEIMVALDVLALLMAYIVGSTFGLTELGVCAGLVLIVPVALVVMSSRVCGKYFWDEL
ncbi:unnamed protein product [Triticum aestivum]|uniref:PGG domain-containing protein n=4 Tax=Triticinae TaxID=1648030 RepID=A0A9R1JF94_WHEAT|nr:hypothetical protein CFC21_028794 [Triticum aestivum]SPT17019.1 unnamed protein product [Triticum aestivum]